MAELAFNQRIATCQRPTCKNYKKERVVDLPVVGDNLYMNAPISCACGWGATLKEDKKVDEIV